MTKNIKKTLLCVLLAMAVIAMGLFSTMTFARGENTAYAASDAATGSIRLGGVASGNVYFGAYQQSSDGNGGYNVDPVKWRVLSNTDDMFLLSEKTLAAMNYGETSNWLNNTFKSEAFSVAENSAVKSISLLSKDDLTKYLSNNCSVTRTDYAKDAYCNWWWLSTQVSGYSLQYCGHGDDGRLDWCSPYSYNAGVRPTLKLNASSVLFASAAADGKSATAGSDLTTVNSYTGNEWKLTIADASRALSVSETQVDVQSAVSGKSGSSTVTLNYSGATVGDNEYISVILADKDGNATHYGKVKKVDVGAGSVEIVVPSGLMSGAYTLHVFNEQCNGEKETDYASAFCDVTLNVTSDGEAAIGKTTYSTLAEALTTAAQNETADEIIIIKRDITLAMPYTLKAGDSIKTFDGFTYKATVDATLTDINVQGGQVIVRITVGANGEFTIGGGADSDVKYKTGDAETTFTILEAHYTSLITGAVELDKDEEITVGGVKVENTGDNAIIVKANEPETGKQLIAIPVGGKTKIGDTEYEAGDKDSTFVIDEHGAVKRCYDMSGVTFEDKTFIYDGESHSLEISGTLPNGVDVAYENNGKTESGVYTVIAKFSGDSEKYAAIADMTATLTIKETTIQPVVDGGAQDKQEVLIFAEGGLDPNTKVVAKKQNEVPAAIQAKVERDEVVAAVYEISFDSDGVSVQPDGNLTIKLLLPDGVDGRTFRILHLHGEEVEEVEECTSEGGYAVFTVNKLSAFAIVVDNGSSVLWLIILLAVIIAAEIVLIALKFIKNKKDRKNTVCLAAATYGGVLPVYQIVLLPILSVVAVALGAYVVYLYFPRKKENNQNSCEGDA